jgi:hypothetical protein
MTAILAKRFQESGRKINWTQIRLFPSDLKGKPSSESLPPGSDSPVNRLMFDKNGTALPPIVFYEILEPSPGVSSNKRSGTVDTAELSPSTKRLKHVEE